MFLQVFKDWLERRLNLAIDDKNQTAATRVGHANAEFASISKCCAPHTWNKPKTADVGNGQIISVCRIKSNNTPMTALLDDSSTIYNNGRAAHRQASSAHDCCPDFEKLSVRFQ